MRGVALADAVGGGGGGGGITRAGGGGGEGGRGGGIPWVVSPLIRRGGIDNVCIAAVIDAVAGIGPTSSSAAVT